MKEEKIDDKSISNVQKVENEVKFQEYIKSASFVMKIISMELFNNITE
jgi:hypothetical protein